MVGQRCANLRCRMDADTELKVLEVCRLLKKECHSISQLLLHSNVKKQEKNKKKLYGARRSIIILLKPEMHHV